MRVSTVTLALDECKGGTQAFLPPERFPKDPQKWAHAFHQAGTGNVRLVIAWDGKTLLLNTFAEFVQEVCKVGGPSRIAGIIVCTRAEAERVFRRLSHRLNVQANLIHCEGA